MKGKYIITIDHSQANTVKVRFDGELEQIDEGVKFVLASKQDISTCKALYRFVANDAVGCRLYHHENNFFQIVWDHEEFLSQRSAFSLEYFVDLKQLKESLGNDSFALLNLKEFLLLPEINKLKNQSLENEDANESVEDYLIEFRFPESFHVFHTLLKDVTLKREKFLYSLNDGFEGHDSVAIMGNYESDGFAINKTKFYFLSQGDLEKSALKEKVSEIIEKHQIENRDIFYQLILFENSKNIENDQVIVFERTLYIQQKNLVQYLSTSSFESSLVKLLS
ncbi:MAG: hypothetical protein GY909_08400 [Oligoflexia bacterium]|nr:hypothetical protein [Oligoflexia bacterium]